MEFIYAWDKPCYFVTIDNSIFSFYETYEEACNMVISLNLWGKVVRIIEGNIVKGAVIK